MSSAVIALLFLTCGWKLYKDWVYTRYHALRNAGHPQYFGGALSAILLFAVTFSLDNYLMSWALYRDVAQGLVAQLPVVQETTAEAGVAQQPNLAPTLLRYFLLSLPITWALIKVLNRPLHRSPELIRAAARKTGILNELEHTIYYCLDAPGTLTLAITLKSKKVYVGLPMRYTPSTDGARDWLVILPMASGYRDDQGDLTLTTVYSSVRQHDQERPPEDYQVVIPLSEIQIAQTFDIPVYTEHRRALLTDAAANNADAATHRQSPDRSAGSQADSTDELQLLLRQTVEHLLPRADRALLRIYAYYIVSLVLAALLLPIDGRSWWFLPVALFAYFALAGWPSTRHLRCLWNRFWGALRAEILGPAA